MSQTAVSLQTAVSIAASDSLLISSEMCHLIAGSLTCPLPYKPRTRRNSLAVTAMHRADVSRSATKDDSKASQSMSRRQAMLGFLAGSLSLGLDSPGRAMATGKEEKQPTIINDPTALKSQLEAQYQQWAAGQFDTWLAAQPETIKWQSTYNGLMMKSKGKAGAQQYFTMLNADLDIQSYKPLAIFVDNDGDEATVVVEATGLSRRTQQPFKTIFLHMYTIGPMGKIIKFKEMTDTGIMAQLIPTAATAAPVAASAPAPLAAAEGGSPVEPGSAARSA